MKLHKIVLYSLLLIAFILIYVVPVTSFTRYGQYIVFALMIPLVIYELIDVRKIDKVKGTKVFINRILVMAVVLLVFIVFQFVSLF